MNIAKLNLTDPSVASPSNWTLITTPLETPLRVCKGESGSCVSAFFSSSGRSYSHVCGKVIGIQGGLPDAFDPTLHVTMT